MSSKNKLIAVGLTLLIVLGGIALLLLLPSTIEQKKEPALTATPDAEPNPTTIEPDLMPTDEELERMRPEDLLREDDEDLTPPTLDPDEEKQLPFGASPSPSPSP